MPNLRTRLIRLAHANPDMRADLLRVLNAGTFTEQEWKTHKEKHPNADPKDHEITKGDGGKGSENTQNPQDRFDRMDEMVAETKYLVDEFADWTGKDADFDKSISDYETRSIKRDMEDLAKSVKKDLGRDFKVDMSKVKTYRDVRFLRDEVRQVKRWYVEEKKKAEAEIKGGKKASFRSQLIRLAHDKPELRPHLLPLLVTAEDKVKVLNENGRVVSVNPETLKGPDASKYKPLDKKDDAPKKVWKGDPPGLAKADDWLESVEDQFGGGNFERIENRVFDLLQDAPEKGTDSLEDDIMDRFKAEYTGGDWDGNKGMFEEVAKQITDAAKKDLGSSGKTAGRDMPRLDWMIPTATKNGAKEETFADGMIRVWRWETESENRRTGRMVTKYHLLMGSGSKRAKNATVWEYHSSASSRDSKVDRIVANYERRAREKAQAREDAKNFQHGYQIGDILYSSWGYDQTNIDYYQVTKLIGSKMIEIQEIQTKVVRSDRGADYVVAVKDRFVRGERPLKKRVNTNRSVKINSHTYAYPWDGKPKYQTSAYAGH